MVEIKQTIESNYVELNEQGIQSVPSDSPQPNVPATPQATSNIVSDGGGSVMVGGAMISPNFSKGNSGWQIDSNGNVEFNDGTFRGALVANSIDIPDTTTANSFHTNSSGDSWWGATTLGSAPASVTKAGAATFTSATISGYAAVTKGAFGGDGSDGALSGTTAIDLASATVVTKNYTSISLTGTQKLTFTNPASTGTMIVLKSTGDVTLTSTATPGCIDASNCGAVGGAAVTGAGTNGNDGTDSNIFLVKTNKGLKGITNADGTGGAAHSLNLGGFSQYQSKYVLTFCGAGGGSGACASNDGGSHSGKGGSGGCILIIECNGDLNFPGTATICNGGQDGDPQVGNVTGNIGGGGGGGGGSTIVLYKTATSAAGTLDVGGGAGGLGDGASAHGGGGGGSHTAGANAPSSSPHYGGVGGNGLSLIAQNTELF